jgi:hypothetical protein
VWANRLTAMDGLANSRDRDGAALDRDDFEAVRVRTGGCANGRWPSRLGRRRTSPGRRRRRRGGGCGSCRPDRRPARERLVAVADTGGWLGRRERLPTSFRRRDTFNGVGVQAPPTSRVQVRVLTGTTRPPCPAPKGSEHLAVTAQPLGVAIHSVQDFCGQAPRHRVPVRLRERVRGGRRNIRSSSTCRGPAALPDHAVSVVGDAEMLDILPAQEQLTLSRDVTRWDDRPVVGARPSWTPYVGLRSASWCGRRAAGTGAEARSHNERGIKRWRARGQGP